ncbi:glutathione peroxidase [Alcanivorax sp. NBRC 102024]|uniref:glutathione peroxidase n=1 Tax=Alcanivorax sp. NBRC 102024 TaxID=1113895 RepID=UPI000AED254E|nr:glutathione peroxidase [Alcanivorax sp. NBRC 102024]
MVRYLGFLFVLLLTPAAQAADECADALDTTVRKLHSQQTLDLCALTRNKLTLVVNTASQCGYTPQFKDLEALYQTYREQGLIVLGFPSDDFRQELDSESDTAEVCYVNYGVTFPMAATSAVKGDSANPVFQALGAATQAPGWNFNKYLISPDGKDIRHFPASAEPRGGELEAAIRDTLAQ